jgi:hypothetical protein
MSCSSSIKVRAEVFGAVAWYNNGVEGLHIAFLAQTQGEPTDQGSTGLGRCMAVADRLVS